MSNKDQEYDRNAALANLTPEERAAIEDDEVTPGDGPTDTGGADDDDDDDSAVDSAADQIDAENKEPEAAAEAAKVEDPPSVEAVDEESAEFRSRYQVQLPEDFNDQVRALDDRESDISRKFKAGEIEIDEFVAESKKLSTDRSKLDRIATKAEIASEMGAQTAEQEWQWTVDKFMRQVKKDEGIDYRNDEKVNDFDAFVKVLANNPANDGKDMDWFLTEAHKRTKALHGVASDKSVDKTIVKPEVKSRKPNLDKLPANLSQVPGGDGPGDVTSEFADIDGLDGLAYETALAKMSLSQRERYLAAA